MKQDDRKPEETVLLNGIPYTGDAAASGKQKSRHRRWKWLTAVSVLGIAMLLPVSAHAGIFDVFSETIRHDPERHRQFAQVDQPAYAAGAATLPDDDVAAGRAQSSPRLRCEFDFRVFATR